MGGTALGLGDGMALEQESGKLEQVHDSLVEVRGILACVLVLAAWHIPHRCDT